MALRRRGGATAPEEIAGYRDLVRIGHGGFSVVYRAFSDRLGRVMALKVLSADLGDERGADRFKRELHLVNRLSGHPHVVSVVDIGVARSGRPYIAMEYYSNGSLKTSLTRGGPLPVADALGIGVKVAYALATAHDAGVLHRDVKPENILLSQYGEPALADFGIGRLTDHIHTGTSARTDALTVQHTAPEVLAGERSSAASDIYSLGSTLYELLDGRPPFHRTTDEGIGPMMLRILNEDPPELRRPDVPAPVVELLRRALAKQPADRFATAAEFASELRSAAGLPEVPEPVVAVAGIPAPAATMLRADRLVSPDQVKAKPRKGVRWGWALAGLTAAVLLGGTAVAVPVLTSHRSGQPHVTAASHRSTLDPTVASTSEAPSSTTAVTTAVSTAPTTTTAPVVHPPATPPVPSDLTVSAVNQTTIRLSWTDNSNSATGTEISNGDNAIVIAPGVNSHDWGGLSPGTYMCFKIRAVYLSGPGSGLKSGFVPANSPYYLCATTPASPTGAPSGLTATAVDPNTIHLTWTDHSAGQARFEINNGETSRYSGAGTTSYDWTGLAPGTYMCFKIRVNAGAGHVSTFVPSTSPYYVCATTPS